MRLEPRVLDLPHPLGARLLSDALLREADEKLVALESRASPEALHDFRVALRRLRSIARSLGPSLAGAVRKKHRRALREVAGWTTEARDAEVQLAWLAKERERTARPHRAALDWLAARLEKRLWAGYESAAEKVAPRFRRLAAELAKGLATPGKRGGERANATFGVLLAGTLRAQANVLFASLDAVSAPFDVERAHEARIAAKRLRYLLEPLRGSERADSDGAVGILKELQDVLGELHDAHVLGDTLAKELVDLASEDARRVHAAIREGAASGPVLGELTRRGPRKGLLALDARATERVGAAYAALTRGWLPARRKALAVAISAIVELLSPRSMGQPGTSRRFLLLGLPRGLPALPELELEEGWLAGEPPREWLMRLTGPDGSTFLRGRGSALDEERLTEERFSALWPQTGALRLTKRRYLLMRGGRSWCVDLVGDRGVVIAETAAPAGELRLPGRLREVLVREVTGERAYEDERMAANQERTRARRSPAVRDGPGGGGAPGPARA